MKSTQLLSVVFSLIMFTGVSAGSVAFADEDLEDRLEEFCEITAAEQRVFFSDFPKMTEYDERLSEICGIDDPSEQSNTLEDFIEEIVYEIKDEDDDYEDFDEEYDELEDDYDDMNDDVIDSFDDCVDAGFAVMESYPEQCMTDDGQVFVNDERYDDDIDSEMREKLERFCDMSDEDKRKYLDENDKTEDHAQKMNRYCTLSESDRADFIADHRDEYKAHMKDRMYDKITDIRKHMDRFCDLSDAEKDQHIAEYEPTQEHIDKVMKYCSLDDEGRDVFVDEHRDEIKAHMKEKYHDYKSDKKHHMNYDRLCAMAESDRAAEITDVAKLDRINNWCDMTPDEREDYKKKHHAEMKGKMHDKMTDRKHDMRMDAKHDKMSDKSKRLKAMIMAKYDISDERLDEIKMKYREKYGDLSDERKSELKMKFKNHMKFMKHHMTDERKAEIHDRISEMRDFKAELRDRASDMTDEEKQQLREEFIEKAKDLQLAWITPRTQIAAGIDAAEVECREGFTLVMKSSNGVPMCLKADTALRMIDREIVVPAN